MRNVSVLIHPSISASPCVISNYREPTCYLEEAQGAIEVHKRYGGCSACPYGTSGALPLWLVQTKMDRENKIQIGLQRVGKETKCKLS